ncbi:MAG: MFS transporter [Actinobacteria bacterium]|nr:MFS transporter [Actinomycetota bacterium]
MRLVVGLGVVSALADIVYEGARSVYGPFLASLGATALVLSVVTGRGWAFAIHEAMDQTGAFLGPLLISASLALTASFGPGLLLPAIPGIAANLVLVYLRRRVHDVRRAAPTAARSSAGRA